MNVCDTDRYSTAFIFCRTMITVYWCGKCFVCLTSSTSRLSFAEFLGKAEPSGGGSRSQWVLHLTRLTTAWHAKTKTEFWSQKETWPTWPQGSPRCTFSHRLWGGGHPSEWSRKRVSSMNPLGLQISEQFFDFKHFLSLSATFCFLEVKKYDTFGRTAIQLPEDTKEYEGYMACLKGSPTPPLRPRGHSDGRLWRVFGCCHGRISVGFSVGEHGRAMSVYSVHLSASQCSKD